MLSFVIHPLRLAAMAPKAKTAKAKAAPKAAGSSGAPVGALPETIAGANAGYWEEMQKVIEDIGNNDILGDLGLQKPLSIARGGFLAWALGQRSARAL